MASKNQIARQLEFTDPRLYARIVRDLAIQEADQLGHRIDILKRQLETLTIQHGDAQEAAAIASQTFAHDYPGEAVPVTLAETFHARKNGIPHSDKQNNDAIERDETDRLDRVRFGQY